MKTIVFLATGEKHSAWHSIGEAKNQIKVLAKYGYRNAYWDAIDHNYDNGYYFI